MDQALVARFIRRVPAVDLAEGGIQVRAGIKGATVVVKDPVKRFDRHGLIIILSFATGFREDFIEHEGSGDHRRPAVKFEPVDRVHVRPAA